MASNGKIRKTVREKREIEAHNANVARLAMRDERYIQQPAKFNSHVKHKIAVLEGVIVFGNLIDLSPLFRLDIESLEFLVPRIVRLNIQRYCSPGYELQMRNEILDLIETAEVHALRVKKNLLTKAS